MEKQFENKVVIVTGAASGIGRATALAFAKEGAKVAVCDVLSEGGNKTVNMIQEAGGEASFIYCDVSKASDVKRMVETVIDKYKKLDIAFNNAGMEGKQALLADSTEDNWDEVIGINLKGVWACMKYELKEMLKNKSGIIVNTSSIAGEVGFPGICAYDASKHGIVGLTQTAALEYAKEGIRINAVCPGVIRTPMIDRFTKGDKNVENQFAQQEPMGRLGEPEEIADAVLWLCSGKSSFVTGEAIPIDGGWVAQ